MRVATVRTALKGLLAAPRARHLPAAPRCGLVPAATAPRFFSSGATQEDIDVDGVAYGFMASQTLFAGLELGIFDHIAEHGPLPIERLQGLCNVQAPRLQTLVTALTSIKALQRAEDGTYSLSTNTSKFLVKNSKYFYGDYLRLQMGQQFYGLMGTLPAVVKTGDAPDYAKWFSDPAEADRYTTAQHNGSMATAKQLTKRVDVAVIKSLLDVGGGSGAWSITLARANEALR